MHTRHHTDLATVVIMVEQSSINCRVGMQAIPFVVTLKRAVVTVTIADLVIRLSMSRRSTGLLLSAHRLLRLFGNSSAWMLGGTPPNKRTSKIFYKPDFQSYFYLPLIVLHHLQFYEWSPPTLPSSSANETGKDQYNPKRNSWFGSEWCRWSSCTKTANIYNAI